MFRFSPKNVATAIVIALISFVNIQAQTTDHKETKEMKPNSENKPLQVLNFKPALLNTAIKTTGKGVEVSALEAPPPEIGYILDVKIPSASQAEYKWPGFKLIALNNFFATSDWEKFKTFRFEVFNHNDTPVSLRIIINNIDRSMNNPQYWEKKDLASNSITQIVINLKRVKKRIGLNDISFLCFYLSEPEYPAHLTFSNFVLETGYKKKSKKIQWPDFTKKPGTPLSVLNCSDQFKNLYKKGSRGPWQLTPAGDIRCGRYTAPPPGIEFSCEAPQNGFPKKPLALLIKYKKLEGAAPLVYAWTDFYKQPWELIYWDDQIFLPDWKKKTATANTYTILIPQSPRIRLQAQNRLYKFFISPRSPVLIEKMDLVELDMHDQKLYRQALHDFRLNYAGIIQRKARHKGSVYSKEKIAVSPRHPLHMVLPTTPVQDKAKTINTTVQASGRTADISWAIRSQNKNKLEIKLSKLKDESGNVIPPQNIQIRKAFYIYSSYPRYFAREAVTETPSYLLPVKNNITIDKDETQWLWLSVSIPENQPGGIYNGYIDLKNSEFDLKLPYRISVCNITLPEPQNIGFFPESPFDDLKKKEKIKLLSILRKYGCTNLAINVQSKIIYNCDENNKVRVDVSKLNDLFGILKSAGYNPQKIPFFLDPLSAAVKALNKNPKLLEEDYPAINDKQLISTAKSIVTQIEDEAIKNGWPKLLWYPIDEPSGPRVKLALALHKLIKSVPGTQVIVASGGDSYLKQAKDFLDYYMVSIGFSSSNLGNYPALKKNFPDIKTAVWGYGQIWGSNCLLYRNCFAYLWANKCMSKDDGLFFWAFNQKFDMFDNMDQVFKKGFRESAKKFLVGQDSGPAFLADGTPVATINMESMRMGIDDLSFYKLLENISEDSSNPEQAKAIKLLREIRSNVNPDINEFVKDRVLSVMPTVYSNDDFIIEEDVSMYPWDKERLAIAQMAMKKKK